MVEYFKVLHSIDKNLLIEMNNMFTLLRYDESKVSLLIPP